MKKFFQKPIILVMLILLGLIFLNSQGYLRPVKDVFFQITSPLEKFIYQISLKINQSINLLGEIRELNQKYASCQEENQKLRGAIGELKELAQENEFLRQQLGLDSSEKRELILANVIGQEPTNLGEYLLIDKGEQAGVKEKAVVITTGNLLVGRVTEVTASLAKVLLITHPSSRVNALIQESRVRGMVKGGAGFKLTLDWVSQQEKIESGQTVITSGLAGLFPKGLLIGQIGEVISKDPQVFQKAEIRPLVDFRRLERVFVIKAGP